MLPGIRKTQENPGDEQLPAEHTPKSLATP